MAKFRKLGGTPYEVTAETMDVLVWLKCQENELHPSYLDTPYNLVQGQRCPICEGRKPITAYIIRYYAGAKLKEDQEVTCKVVDGAVTTIEEAKSEVIKVLNGIKKKSSNTKNEDLVLIKDIAPTCPCGGHMIAEDINGNELIGRMEGTFTGGEFFIEIIKA